MRVTAFPVYSDISVLVSKLLLIENKSAVFSFKTIPRNYPALFFMAPEEGRWEVKIGGIPYLLAGGNVYFAGIGFQPSHMYFSGCIKLWVIMLQPYAARMVSGEAADTFVNQVVRITDTHILLRNLNDQLWDKHIDLKNASLLIEKHIRNYLQKANISCYVLSALNEINKHAGKLNMLQLADKTYTCNRNLLRRFSVEIGLNPKKYTAMIRFSHVMKDRFENPEIDLETLAIKHHYYDTSHLNREAFLFMGEKLSKYTHPNKGLNDNLL